MIRHTLKSGTGARKIYCSLTGLHMKLKPFPDVLIFKTKIFYLATKSGCSGYISIVTLKDLSDVAAKSVFQKQADRHTSKMYNKQDKKHAHPKKL